MKKSIKMLGPTDPSVVQGYVKREKEYATDKKPGYMIGKTGAGNQWV